MPGMEFRYVGIDRLPARMSEFDVERYFALTDSDMAEVNERFRRDWRAGAAIQLVFLRALASTPRVHETFRRWLKRNTERWMRRRRSKQMPNGWLTANAPLFRRSPCRRQMPPGPPADQAGYRQ